MSLAGYRDLATLKSRLLPAGMGEDWEYDDDLRAIGLGVAAAFDDFTGRTLRRTVGAVHECAADVATVIVGCYPIETVSSVKVSDGVSEWDSGEIIAGVKNKSGIVHLYGAPGLATQTLRITVTGGYWCEDREGDDTTLPAGATALPDSLLNAWYQQCRQMCDAENLIRSKAAGKPDKKGGGPELTTMEFIPAVRNILQLHARFS